jgi:tRNA threonylcarbamoyladenosine biosynthesis protein TsaE
MLKLYSDSTEQTEKIGRILGEMLINKKFFIALYGDLGAGKTVFVRGLASVLSPGSRVKSPTFTLVNEYRNGKIPLFHFDLYRINSLDELDGFGFDEYIENGSCIAEWSEKLGNSLPENTLKVKIEKIDDNTRCINIGGEEIDNSKFCEFDMKGE